MYPEYLYIISCIQVILNSPVTKPCSGYRPCHSHLSGWQDLCCTVCNQCHATGNPEQCILWPSIPTTEKSTDTAHPNGFCNQDRHILWSTPVAWEWTEWCGTCWWRTSAGCAGWHQTRWQPSSHYGVRVSLSYCTFPKEMSNWVTANRTIDNLQSTNKIHVDSVKNSAQKTFQQLIMWQLDVSHKHCFIYMLHSLFCKLYSI